MMTPVTTGPVNFGPLFSLGKNEFWPTLSRGQAIPATLAASANPVVALGMVKALCALLSHLNGAAMEAQSSQNARWQVWLASNSSPIVHQIGGEGQRWQAKFPGYLVGIAGAMDTLVGVRFSLAGYGPAAATFCYRWQELLDCLQTLLSSPPPYSQQQLVQSSADQQATAVMMAATDALYVQMQDRKNQGVVVEETDASGVLTASPADLAWLYGTSSAAPTQPPAVVSTEIVKTLSRVLRRGRTALLIGPTGAGKTEAVKQAALAVGATLVKIEGHPGLDDKLLFGGVYPTGQGGFAYVEGPLSEAWRYAAEGQQVVLQLDELARMDSYYHALLIGALDTLSGAEIVARPKLAQAATQVPFVVEPTGRYRVLNLPNGTVLLAPAGKLSVIATTNLGSAYQQASAQLDPALLRRFSVRLEVERLAADERRAILERAGVPTPMAQALVALEEFTMLNTGSQGGLLQEALNLGVLLDWGQEALALVEEGTPWPRALADTAEYTAVPFCCPRLADGRLEPPVVNVLRDEIKKTARTL